MSEFDRVKAEAIAGPHYDRIPERAKVGGVWGAMRTAAKEAYMAGRAEAAAERTAAIITLIEAAGGALAIAEKERDAEVYMAVAKQLRGRYPNAFPKE